MHLKGPAQQEAIALFLTIKKDLEKVKGDYFSISQRLLELSERDDRSIISQFLGGVDIQIRYATREEAIAGHARICNFIEVCMTNGLIEVEKG